MNIRLFLCLCLVVSPLRAATRLSINPWQAFVYRDIITHYEPSSGYTSLSSGSDASAPLQFEAKFNAQSSLTLRILNPAHSFERPIARCTMSIGDKTLSFDWTSPNGLMTTGDFTEAHESLFRFMADNARGKIRLDFYGRSGEFLNSASPTAEQASKIFQAFRLYKEIALGEFLGGFFSK